jgi:hypothetical protein
MEVSRSNTEGSIGERGGKCDKELGVAVGGTAQKVALPRKQLTAPITAQLKAPTLERPTSQLAATTQLVVTKLASTALASSTTKLVVPTIP